MKIGGKKWGKEAPEDKDVDTDAPEDMDVDVLDEAATQLLAAFESGNKDKLVRALKAFVIGCAEDE